MKDKLEILKGKEIELFDETGGCLNAQGKYVPNWWEISSIVLERIQGKYFFVRNMNNKFEYRLKVDSVVDIHENCVTIGTK